MLTTTEQLRYSRQIMLPEIGVEGQLKLANAKVLIVGIGGLGNPVSMYLNAAGIGTLILADGDEIDITNLQRQILFSQEDVGQNKAEIACEKLQQNNTLTNIEIIDEMLDAELCNYYFPQVDVVIDCTDNIATRYLINKYCIEYKIPFVVGAATGFDGQHLFINNKNDNAACYQCLFPEAEKAPINNCQTNGILGPVLSMIAGMQALQTIKYLAGIPISDNCLHLFDGRSMQWQQFAVKKQPLCKACSTTDK